LENAMSTPTVTEIRPRPEAVTHDTFVDDLRRREPAAAAPYTTAQKPHSAVADASSRRRTRG